MVPGSALGGYWLSCCVLDFPLFVIKNQCLPFDSIIIIITITIMIIIIIVY